MEYHPPQDAKQPADGSATVPARVVEPSKTRAVQALVAAMRSPQENETLAPFDAAALALLTAYRPPSQDAQGGSRVLMSRVDWFTSAFRVAFREDTLRQLVEALGEQERVPVTLAGYAFELRKMRTGKRLLLRNADVGVVLDPEGPEGWTVQVDCPGATMMRTSLDTAVSLVRTLARGLGTVQGERVRRLDLCCDIGGWHVEDIDGEAFVKPSRARQVRDARVEDLEKGWENPDMRQYRRGTNVTGYTVCPGNELSCVIYDKREELSIRVDKQAAEEERWRNAGWNGSDPVTRVEFRLRSAVLHDLEARDGLDAFREKLDAIWSYCTRNWLRLVVRAAADRLNRCPVDHVWRVVRSCIFKHAASPAMRNRVRLGATAAHAFGSMMSFLASSKGQPAPHEVVMEDGEVVDDVHRVLATMNEQQAHDFVHNRLVALATATVARVGEELIDKLGAMKAAAHVLFREGAARARFSTCLELGERATPVAA